MWVVTWANESTSRPSGTVCSVSETTSASLRCAHKKTQLETGGGVNQDAGAEHDAPDVDVPVFVSQEGEEEGNDGKQGWFSLRAVRRSTGPVTCITTKD
mmetsp:Transcript_21824/g.43918  ORF Transcript_21824/g.43918 Transcript_21824/m.43918 type:complete len:99 (+) Transcript_21824:125-421(+)